MNFETLTSDSPFQTFFVARQPIFDVNQTLWGFELLFRDGHELAFARIKDPNQATITVSSCGFMCSTSDLPGEVKICINFTEQLILDRIPHALPAANTVVEILENVPVTTELIERLIDLKNEGFTLAVDDFVGGENYRKIRDYVDIIKFECMGHSIEEILALKNEFADMSCLNLAEKVESESMFLALRENGFDLFQGYYFAKPQNLSGRKLNSLATSRLQLIMALEQEELDFEAIRRTVEADVSLSYRLLKYINSASHSFRNKITSLNQALTLLGFKKIRDWLRLIVLSDIQSKNAHPETMRLALQRARFMALAGMSAKPKEMTRDCLFLTGLFSLLESILLTPMDTILETLPVSPDIRNALLGREGKLSTFIHLAQSMENGEMDRAVELGLTLGLSYEAINEASREAIVWVDETIGNFIRV